MVLPGFCAGVQFHGQNGELRTFHDIRRNSISLGNQIFTQDNQQYFSTARLDATLTQKIRVFGSWLYQYTRETGDSLPDPDSTTGLLNTGLIISGRQYRDQ